jgi:molybdopterin/thiamine biosynthesis adenylyltransferase
MGPTYEELTARNARYIGEELQQRIRATGILVAGCGLGSVVAEAAARSGFARFELVDPDTVDATNLNRQVYTAGDVGKPKVEALAARLRAINAGVRVRTHCTFVNADNVRDLLERCELVFDTIDFLDLPAIVGLHDAARAAGRTVISSFSAGWGAVSAVFTPQSETLRGVCGLPPEGPVEGASYTEVFGAFLRRLAPSLPKKFVAVTGQVIRDLADGKPCPAPQLAAGAASAASLMVTQAIRLLAGLPVTTSPEFVLLDPDGRASSPGISLGG